MREVSVKVYKFEELDADIQTALVDQMRENLEIGEQVLEFLEDRLATTGLKGVTLEDFSIGAEDEEDFILLDGEIAGSLHLWENDEEFGQYIPMVANVFISAEDSDDDNPFGILIGRKEGAEFPIDDFKYFIEEKMEMIVENLIQEASDYIDKITDDSELIKELQQYEYFADGTLYDEESMV